VHPTGIAVDLRRPPAGPCQTWVRNALAELENKGFIEATEERHPAHLHVAVLTEPGRVATLPPLDLGTLANRTPAPAAPRAVSPLPAATRAVARQQSVTKERTYRVRAGDTLWDVAQKNGVSVRALARANHRSERSVLRPGVSLRIPGPDSR
jgi:nucleoid-associated protein YgaU